jgi:hypothetical protein
MAKKDVRPEPPPNPPKASIRSLNLNWQEEESQQDEYGTFDPTDVAYLQFVYEAKTGGR